VLVRVVILIRNNMQIMACMHDDSRLATPSLNCVLIPKQFSVNPSNQLYPFLLEIEETYAGTNSNTFASSVSGFSLANAI
jgi:hypothetical protein